MPRPVATLSLRQSRRWLALTHKQGMCKHIIALHTHIIYFRPEVGRTRLLALTRMRSSTASARTVPECSRLVARGMPVSRLHSRTVLSALPDAPACTNRPQCHASEVQRATCQRHACVRAPQPHGPVRTACRTHHAMTGLASRPFASSMPEFTLHSHIVMSALPAARMHHTSEGSQNMPEGNGPRWFSQNLAVQSARSATQSESPYCGPPATVYCKEWRHSRTLHSRSTAAPPCLLPPGAPTCIQGVTTSQSNQLAANCTHVHQVDSF